MIQPLPDTTIAEIESLADDLDVLLSRKPRGSVTGFHDRRRALLEKHIGRTLSDRPFEPITCIGDSHTMFFAGAERLRFIRYRRSAFWKPCWINRGLDLLPCFRVFHVGPATAWKAADKSSSTRAYEKIEILLKKDVLPGSPLLLSFGEIDCRVHMPKATLAGGSIEKITKETAEKFIRLPSSLLARGYQPVVWGPPSVVPEDAFAAVPAVPFIGPWELRRDITYSYIEHLREKCSQIGVPMVSIAGKYHSLEAKPPSAFFPDGNHLSQRLMPFALQELERAGVLSLPVSPLSMES
ncbi:MAG: hypothetical protein EAZ65_01255 [Verrucomicrobia bacterium]|nr:MAG: hypothetical protein EAZ84_06170 [Verrucomicrobiota bacterium]TAE89165.1 MAG: hypothetical protein EAZ82_00640 [Verrucomicrobiota bacterium]TAF27959.1 MAG: hypothetical protein EAZ71_01260 [Verrucomicrobiota bacterium]TAF42807.1 MAG: hypothetical protein EAZ65_01255 [Verrucomicrobiota bacterium]